MASPEHIARRLRRLEWATRYRPVHIQTLLLGGIAPRDDAEFLYEPSGEFCGEAAELLRAVGISAKGKTAEAVHTEFQGAGFFLTHILECPIESMGDSTGHRQETAAEAGKLLREHLPAVASRVRRSLKPSRVTLVTEVPPPVVQDVLSMNLDCPIVLDDGRPFRLSSTNDEPGFSRFRKLLAAARGN